MASPTVDKDQAEAAPDPVASALVAACEAAWAEIQRHHPELPPAIIVLGTGVQRGRLVKLGHWWQSQWVADGAARGEVLLAGEALHLPADQVLEILVHEAAHGINCARGVKDTSREGRYHNQKFKATAAEVGLRVQRMDPYGWARTTLRPETIERYAGAISTVNEHLRIARALPRQASAGIEGRDDGGTAGIDGEGEEHEAAKKPAAECGCGRKMRMAPSVLAKGPVVCTVCESEFTIRRQPEHTSDRAAAATPATEPPDFVDRRQQQLNAEGEPPDRLQEGLDFLADFERAMEIVAAQTGDQRPLKIFREERPAIVEWFKDFVTADVVEIDDRRESPIDLRSVPLPQLGPPPAERPNQGREISGPEL